jgi:phosphatidate cytidylyltransferase
LSFGGELGRRVATAVVALPLVLLVLFRGSPTAAVGLVGLAVLLATFEFFGLLGVLGLSAFRRTGLFLTAAMFLDVVYPEWHGPTVWPLAALLLFSVMLLRGSDLRETVPAAAGTLLGALYVGALGGTIGALRTLAPVAEGAWRLVLLLAVVMSSDTAAFFVGHAWGRRRLAPALSPGKTVEGALGGLAGGALAALAVARWGLPSLPLSHALGLGVVVSGMGIVGDLDESLLKRWAGVKDSGTLFPGHGGMLDRLDSLLFGAPVLYYYFVYTR